MTDVKEVLYLTYGDGSLLLSKPGLRPWLWRLVGSLFHRREWLRRGQMRLRMAEPRLDEFKWYGVYGRHRRPDDWLAPLTTAAPIHIERETTVGRWAVDPNERTFHADLSGFGDPGL